MSRSSFWRTAFFVGDLLTAFFSWSIFYFLRQAYIEKIPFKADIKFIEGTLLVTVLWMLFYTIQGTYADPKRTTRFSVLRLTFISSFVGTVILFLGLILDDQVNSYQDYYFRLLLLFGIHFGSTIFVRLFLATRLIAHLRKPGCGFKTLLIGGSEKAVEIYQELTLLPNNTHDYIGFVQLNGSDKSLEKQLPLLGHFSAIQHVLNEHHIEEVILAIDSTEHSKLREILAKIDNGKLKIKALPDMSDLLFGFVRHTDIYGALLIDVVSDGMPKWQQIVKRLIDVFASCVAVILLIPFYILAAIAVKFSSKGPIFYLQERIGLNGKPFKIIKFRTMYVNAEAAGPQLSSSDDPRITPIGRWMRKTRLDEFPQFINVILGQMSLVGPRPERQFFIDQIVERESQYLHLTNVRPGITSWGQVKYGYAENVDQMLQRMKFDLLYLKNRSLALDFKIMFHTVAIIFKAKGK